MDITYLLWLQDIRLQFEGLLDPLFNVVSSVLVAPAALVLCCLLYWCVDKRAAWFSVTSFAIGTNLNQTIKDTFCVARPWIRSLEIHPSKAAIGGATSYSFPSGHTQTATSVFGAASWYFKDAARWLVPAALTLIGLIGFSRNILGVHMPQDVLAGFCVGVVSIWLGDKALRWMESATTPAWQVALTFCGVAAMLLVYTLAKPYPREGLASMANVMAMQKDAFTSVGLLAGLGVSWWAEKAFVNFQIDRSNTKECVLRVICGFGMIAFVWFCLLMPLKLLFDGGFIYKFAVGFLLSFTGLVVGPALSKKLYPLISGARDGAGEDAGTDDVNAARR